MWAQLVQSLLSTGGLSRRIARDGVLKRHPPAVRAQFEKILVKMAAVALLVAVFCVSVLHAVHSLRIVGHAIGGSETLEREKFEISSKADPNDGVQGDKRKLTEKQAVVMFQVKPVDDDDSQGMGGEMKAMPMSVEKDFEAEAERGDSVGDVSKAMRKALGNAVAEFLPGSRSESQR